MNLFPTIPLLQLQDVAELFVNGDVTKTFSQGEIPPFPQPPTPPRCLQPVPGFIYVPAAFPGTPCVGGRAIGMTAVTEEHGPFYCFIIIGNSDKSFFPKLLAGEMI